MKNANGFCRQLFNWRWAVLALSLALILPAKEFVLGPNQSEAQVPELVKDRIPVGKGTVIRLQNALAPDVAAAINDLYQKKADGQKSPDMEKQVRPAVVAEPITNSLLVSANPADLAEIMRIASLLDVALKHYLVQVKICEGDPTPTLREAREKGTLVVLARPQITTLENQVALFQVGQEIQVADGPNSKTRNVGISLQVTVGRGNDKEIPARIIHELSSLNEQFPEGAPIVDVHHLEHTGRFISGEPLLLRGGRTRSGKDLWIEATVTHITSHAQVEKLSKEAFE